MPLFSSKLELTSAASSSGVAIADIQFVRGAFRTVADLTSLNNIPVSQVSDKQIVWVEGESDTYQATVTLADFVNTFTDSVSWSTFSGFGGGGGGSGDITAVVAGDGLGGGALSGSATLTLETGSAHFISGSQKLNIFAATGSYFAASKELQLTGSLNLRKDESGDAFGIYSGSVKTFSVTSEGVLRLVSQSTQPTAEPGGIYLDDNYNLWIGQE